MAVSTTFCANCDILEVSGLTLVLLDGAGLQEETGQGLRHDDALLVRVLHRYSETLYRQTDTSAAHSHQEVAICNTSAVVRREECDTYLTHHHSGENPVKT